MKVRFEEVINVKISKENKERAERRAEELGKTLSAYIRDLVFEDYYESRNKKKR